jgi:hypothetical protein
MKTTYKCGFSKCKYGGTVNKDEAVIENNKYYHKECLHDKKNRIKIRESFLDKVNPNEVYTFLNKVISDIIDNKNVSSDYLLFALEYAINNTIKLNYAAGLYYLINNERINTAYKNKTNKLNIDANEVKIEKQPTFNTIQQHTGWNKILE